MRLSVELRRLVEEKLDDIVTKAEKAVGSATDSDREKETQFRNIQNIASATDSLAVIRNFIRYQMGRDQISPKVAEKLLEDIERLGKEAENIAREKGFLDHKEFRAFRAEFVRLYLGFFVRALKAQEKSQ